VAESKTGIGSAKVNQLADSKGFLEDPTQVGLQVVSQKIHSSRSADASGASAIISESVISVISVVPSFLFLIFLPKGQFCRRGGCPKVIW
jgi:hypothetical protein